MKPNYFFVFGMGGDWIPVYQTMGEHFTLSLSLPIYIYVCICIYVYLRKTGVRYQVESYKDSKNGTWYILAQHSAL